MKVLIDTNIILDALMQREPFRIDAEDIIQLAATGAFEGSITANSITDIYYILRKHLQDKQQAKQAILALMSIVTVLDVTSADCERALDSNMPDFEDALLAYCAKRNKMGSIITRNLKDYEASPVEAISPAAFLNMLSRS